MPPTDEPTDGGGTVPLVATEEIEVDGVRFLTSFDPGTRRDRFHVNKEPLLLDATVALGEAHRGGRIVELGIAQGGSTALLALVARPSRLIAVDLSRRRVAALDELLEARGLTDRVTAHYGVDQADGDALGALVDEQGGPDPLDLVIDDASHDYGPTRSSFEALFPRLRPGGQYVIEDWNWEQRLVTELPSYDEDHALVRSLTAKWDADRAAGRPPMMRLALELVLARATMTEWLADLVMTPWWLLVTRGTAEGEFPLSELTGDQLGLLA